MFKMCLKMNGTKFSEKKKQSMRNNLNAAIVFVCKTNKNVSTNVQLAVAAESR